ncbi:hypothetical protein BDV38DRAFT_99927 [Aspergillus pseudotamarii]|uniref:Uncharacterized protein n=1 Tax=Aspergillus pseudotamarii TaxID=132259 RepID=A0A5N6STG7_ASPPS|nr:uncharacterized protein BDV38DRAFT_99927 [Aspergillus pseudotamarii]KAE8137050.1 hypothetical protein BDV38DRAFT_99927 [Aspergillus pseudotamarii]
MPSLDGLVLTVVSALLRGPSFVTAHSRLPKVLLLLSLTILVVNLPVVIHDLLSCSLLLLNKTSVVHYQSSAFYKYRCLAARAVSLVACRIRHPKLAPFLFLPLSLNFL